MKLTDVHRSLVPLTAERPSFSVTDRLSNLPPLKWFGLTQALLSTSISNEFSASSPIIYDTPTLEATEKAPRQPKNKEKTDTQLWASETYFREKFLSLRDLESFFDEYVGMFAHKQYHYSIYGIPEDKPSYKLTSEVCADHRRDLFKARKKTDRADLEMWVAQTLEHWMLTPEVQMGTKLITVSPRGTVDEGYPGTKAGNYVFVNVYEKVPLSVSPTGFLLNQFTSYDTNYQLGLLQKEFQTTHGARFYHPLALPHQPKNSAHRIISQVLQVGPEVRISQLQTHIQSPERQEKWPFKLKDLPQIDAQLFHDYRKTITDYCQTQFKTLCENQDPTTAATDFNDLIYVVRRWFIKWTEDHAHNYQHLKLTITTDFPTPQELLATIEETWYLKLKAKKPETISKEEQERLKKLLAASALNPLGVLTRASSMAHCVVLSPVSLANQGLNAQKFLDLKTNIDLLKTGKMLSAHEIKAFQEYLQSLTPIFVTNRQTGEVEVFYLKIFDPQHVDDYTFGCYKETTDGPILGPCGVALADDPLVDFEHLLTEKEYLQMKKTLLTQKVGDIIHEKQEITEKDHQHIEILVRKLCQKIFKVSLSNLVSGIMSYDSESIFDLPAEYVSKLLQSPHPLKTLELLVTDLEDDALTAIEETVIYETPPPPSYNYYFSQPSPN